MAEVDFNQLSRGYGASHRSDKTGGGSRRMVNLVGATASVALAIGAGLWGYKIADRNIRGIPVISADHEPMRVAPEKPGGTVAAYQGLSVNEIAAIGAAMPLPEEIVLAPRPAELISEDIAGLAPAPPAGLVAPVAGLPAPQPGADHGPGDSPPAAPAAVPAANSPEAEPTPEMLALAEALGVAPPLASPADVADAEITAPVVAGGIGASLLPRARPGLAAQPLPRNPAAQTRETDPATIPAGTQLVQFGAFASADEAREHWLRLVSRFGDLMHNKGRIVVPARSGERTFFRLRAEGFGDEADARRFCSAITAEGADCIPVLQR